MPKQAAQYIFLSLALAFACGCSHKVERPPVTVTEAQKNFEKICRDEFDMQVMSRMVGSTLWIYLPTEKPMFDYEAQKENGESLDSKKIKYAVNYLDGNFKNKSFNLEYDIIDKKKSSKDDYGYSSSYTEAYAKMQNNLFTAVSECFFSAKPTSTEKQPRFVVIVITDIKKGIESRATFYLQDFKRYMTGDLPYDEYMKRFLADTKGGQSFIGDETGSHLDYHDITMEDFLMKQIINRINFKFQRSDFPPDPNFDDTIIGIVADTLRYYHFENFANVRLNNLRLNTRYLFDKAQLVNFGDDKPGDEKSKGKLIHIIFENGKTKVQDTPDDNDSQPSSNTQVTTNSV